MNGEREMTNCYMESVNCAGCPDPCATNYVSGSDSCKIWPYDGCMPGNPTGDDACSEAFGGSKYGCCHYEGCNDVAADNFWCDYLPNSDGSSCGGNCMYSACFPHAYYFLYCDSGVSIDHLDDDAVSGLTCTYESGDVYGCMDDTACNYNPNATNSDGSCEYPGYFGWCDCDENVPGDPGWPCTSGTGWDNGSDPGSGYYDCNCQCIAGLSSQPGSGIDCANVCGGELEPDCCGVCGGDNSQCSNCCGSPFYEDCSDDCAIDLNGECCYELEVDECGVCGGDGTDCNNNGMLDVCEEVYAEGYDLGNAEGYTTGLEEGILLGGQSGDANGDGTLDVLDIVYFIDVILNP